MKIAVSVITAFILTASASEHQCIPNHLKGQTSPYLKQHECNPVNWYPWGKEAFEKAKREHKPIFLSIGYSTCHWCHVMERESFENKKIADILNRYYISVKVDREEMPDLDKHFQLVHDVMNQSGGGWPLTIIMTEDAKPFFSATYIPAGNRYGRRGLQDLLPYIARIYQNDKKQIEDTADKISKRVTLLEKSGGNGAKYTNIKADRFIQNIIHNLYSYYDKKHGGFGYAPKFPQVSRLVLAVDIYGLTGDRRVEKVFFDSLRKISKSGLYDQIEGGFFRYTVDGKWEIPHFEKMLYTNAELIPQYLRGYRWSGDSYYLKIAKDTADIFIKRYMSSENLFFGSSDADSQGGEGRYFVYDYDDTLEALERAGIPEDVAKKALEYFGITDTPNFDGEYSHSRIYDSIKVSNNTLTKSLKILQNIRSKREYPFIDHKNIASWNAMMIKALFDLSIDDGKYLKIAKKSYDAFKTHLTDGKREIYHQRLSNRRATQNGMLEDYAFAVEMAIEAYEKTLDRKYIDDAHTWTKRAIEKFYDNGKWLYSLRKEYKIYADFSDSQYASALATMLDGILKLSAIENDLSYQKYVIESFSANEAFPNGRGDLYPTVSRVFLEWKKGIAILKSSKDKLLASEEEIERVKYPYLLIKDVDSDIFNLCDTKSCFAYGKDLKTVLNRLKDR